MAKPNDIRIRLLIACLVLGSSLSSWAATPSVPTGLTAKAPLDSHVSLSWNASSGASTYTIYRGTSAGGETQLKTGVTITTYEDSNLSNNQIYYYYVKAVNGGTSSGASAEVSALTKEPVVSNFSGTAGNSQVTLTWTASPNALGYRLYRDTLGGPAGAANFIVTGTSYTDTGLINGTVYYYELSTINASGENNSFAPGIAVTPTAGGTKAPAIAAVVTAAAGNAKMILTWTPVSNATSYQILRGTSPSSVTTAVGSSTTLTYTDTGLTNGTAYSYVVKAVNTAGQTSSNVVTATPFIPTAPSLTATGGKGQITITWPTVPGTSYAIYRGVSTGAETMLDQGLTGNTYTDAGLTKGGTYYYYIVLSNPGGTSAPSSEVSATATAPSPSPANGTVLFNLSGEPVQSCTAYIPDLNRPVAGALIMTLSLAPIPNLQALAQKYNLLIITTGDYNFGPPSSPLSLNTTNDSENVQVFDWRWPFLSGQRLQTILTNAATQFGHSEIQNTGVILYGFSEGVDNVNLAVSPSYDVQTATNGQPGIVTQSAFANRLLAIVQLSEFDEASVNPLTVEDTVPHLFLASGVTDGCSSLNLYQNDFNFNTVTYDALTRGIATTQGGPLTVIDNVGNGHGQGEDNPFISIWLDSILSQRLPVTVPTSSPVSLASWQNASSWVGTYNVSTNSSAPWVGVQLINNLISQKSTYTDSRPFTWLPSRNIANAWLAYANQGTLASLAPAITSPTTATATAGGTFSYQITATGLPTGFSATGLPSSLTLDSTTGIISNTPNTTLSSGVYNVTLGATNAEGTTTASLAITVGATNPQYFTAWANSMGISTDPTVSAQMDGIADLMKFFCNIDPRIPMTPASRAALPTLGWDTTSLPGTTYLVLTYRQNPSAAGVTPQLQTSSDLVTWSSPAGASLISKTLDQVSGLMEMGIKITGTTIPYVRLHLQLTHP